MSPSAPAVSVIIPARNDAAHLPAAVESVMRQVGAAVRECVIAVGPSDDDTAAVAARLAADHPGVTVIENPAGFIPVALNLALAATTGDVIVRVDAHCQLPPDYVARATETLAQSGAANVVAVQVPRGETATGRAVAAAMSHPLGSGGAAYRAGVEPGPVETGFLGVFDRVTLESVGGWDESLKRNEDAELNIRLNEAQPSAVWLDPKLRVAYTPRSTLPGLARQFWSYGRWRAVTVRRHPRRVKLRQLAAPLVVVGLAASIAGAIIVTPWALVVTAIYVLVVTIAALLTRRLPPALRPRMAAAFAVMHVAWGAGFLVSLVSAPR